VAKVSFGRDLKIPTFPYTQPIEDDQIPEYWDKHLFYSFYPNAIRIIPNPEQRENEVTDFKIEETPSGSKEKNVAIPEVVARLRYDSVKSLFLDPITGTEYQYDRYSNSYFCSNVCPATVSKPKAEQKVQIFSSKKAIGPATKKVKS
jgi:hypothetical protein